MFQDAIRFAQTTLTQRVVVAPSLNLESTAAVDEVLLRRVIAESDGDLLPEKKTTVDQLVIYDDQHGKAAKVTYATGHTQIVPLPHLTSERVVAGSSANLANVLARMGTQAVGIISAVGSGSDGEAIYRSLEAHGFSDLALLRRSAQHGVGGTAESLFLKTPAGTTVGFSKKPPWSLDGATRAYFSENLRSRVVACTGFLPFDFPLVEALFSASYPEARILSPHRGCFENAPDRAQCLHLAKKATLVQLNRDELAELLELELGWEGANEDRLKATLSQVPSQIVCVTLNSAGSLTYLRQTDQLLRKPAAKVERVSHPVGAGDVHLGALIWYLWLRDRRVDIETALETAAWIAARKLEFQGDDARPWDGIPDSSARKEIVHAAEERVRRAQEGGT